MRRSGRDLLSRSVDRESLRDEEIKAEIEREFCTPLIPRCVQATRFTCVRLCNPVGASVYRISPGRNSGVCCHALLQGIFPSQGSNLCLLPCRQILCRLKHQGSPGNMEKLTVMPLNTDPVACLGDFSGGAWRSPRKGYFKRRCHSEHSWAQVCIRHETPDTSPTWISPTSIPASSAGEGQRQRWADQTPKPTRITW